MWTPSALASELHPARGKAWRAVEDQHGSAGRRLVDTPAEQEVLEEILEESRPPVPAPCLRLHRLLQRPFRYEAPPPHGSRFRRHGDRRGVLYASAHVAAALAEAAFWRLLFFMISAARVTPRNTAVLTLFAVDYRTERCLDLAAPPLDAERRAWTAPADYAATQALAESARDAGAEVLRYESVRDPARHRNVAILGCAAFAGRQSGSQQTWRLWIDADGADARRAVGDEPPLVFTREVFANDPRIAPA